MNHPNVNLNNTTATINHIKEFATQDFVRSLESDRRRTMLDCLENRGLKANSRRKICHAIDKAIQTTHSVLDLTSNSVVQEFNSALDNMMGYLSL